LFVCVLYVVFQSGSEAFEAICRSCADSVECPLDACHSAYQADVASNPNVAILAYKRFEAAIDSLPAPIAIVCKSATRASAVLAAYKGVTGKMTVEQVEEYAKANGV
jgi:protein tyrosine phosphatase (PTP) superfamily phosphohydrolase (DUF442 family)